MPFMPDDTFDDREGRTIGIDVDDGGARVYSGEKKIGEFSVNIVTNDKTGDYFVEAGVVDLDKEFRRAGIASEMMKRIFELHGKQIIPPPTYDPNPGTRNSISSYGMALLKSGQRHGWVTDFPDQLPDPEDDFEDGEEEPPTKTGSLKST
jgi:hypothetical protein